MVSLRDDGYRTFPSAAYCAAEISGAKFVGYDAGGHLWVGHQDEVMREITQFLETECRTFRDRLATTR